MFYRFSNNNLILSFFGDYEGSYNVFVDFFDYIVKDKDIGIEIIKIL